MEEEEPMGPLAQRQEEPAVSRLQMETNFNQTFAFHSHFLIRISRLCKLEEPQRHACQHARKTSRFNQLTRPVPVLNADPTATSQAHTRKQKFPKGKKETTPHCTEPPPVLHTWHCSKWTDGWKKERMGRRESWPSPLSARATVHTLSSWQASLIWITFFSHLWHLNSSDEKFSSKTFCPLALFFKNIFYHSFLSLPTRKLHWSFPKYSQWSGLIDLWECKNQPP